MDPLLKNLVRIGVVSSVNAENCTARVAFESQNTVSYELPIIVRGSLTTKDYWLPAIGDQVLCMCLPSGNAQGYVLGSFYSTRDIPPVADKNKRHLAFEDGTTIEYDQNTHELIIDVKETITIKAPKGIKLIADDPTGEGVEIIGKSSSESW